MGKRIAVIALILLASLNLSGCVSSGGPDIPANNSNASETPERGVGAEARLFLEGQNSIMVANDEKALNEMINALSYGKGVGGLIESDRVFTVPNNTRIRILEIATGKIKVRINEGDNFMREGWVHELWIK
jgi:hypothetical protein